MKDSKGNIIKILDNKIYLELANEDWRREIATISSEDSRDLIVKRNYDKHLFRKNKSFGINYLTIKKYKNLRNVILKTNKKETFVMSREFLLDKGEFMNFQEQGFERQIFIKLEDLAKI